MKFVNLSSRASREEIAAMLSSSDAVNDRVKFDEKLGKPVLHIKEKGNKIKMKCELVGGPSKDNGFLEGTSFFGTFKERDGVITLKGIILTAPIYHTMLFALFAFYIYRCITLRGINPVPIILFFASILLFRTEFKKQGMIQRYLNRAFRILNNTQ